MDDVEDPDDSIDEDAAPEEEDSDPKVRKAAKSGRKAERKRWAKVMSHASIGPEHAPAACQMLSTTPMTASAVVRTLSALPVGKPVAASGRDRLDARMAARPAPKVGADVKAASPESDFGGFAAATLKKVRG